MQLISSRIEKKRGMRGAQVCIKLYQMFFDWPGKEIKDQEEWVRNKKPLNLIHLKNE